MVVEVKFLQGHVGIVADVGEVVGHDVPSQYLLVATLLHRDAYILALVEDLKSHQVIVDLEGGVKHLPIREVMLRGGDLFDTVGTQGKRLGGGNALAVGGDGVNHIQALVIDLKGCPLQQCPSLILGNGVIIRCLFDDLDAPLHRLVFNDHLGGLPGFYGDSADGGVHHISGCLDLLEFVLPGGQFLGKLDDALLVGGVLAQQVVSGIVQVEHHPINRGLGFSIHLFNTEGGLLFVQQFHRAGLPPGQSDLMDRFV